MITAAHRHGVPVLVDGSQAIHHITVDVQVLDADFYVFTGHKLYGPTGIGVLYGKERLLEEMPPYQGGGDMIETVSFEKSTFKEPPFRFEAGTPAIIQVIGLGAAIDYLWSIGFDAIEMHEGEMLRILNTALRDIEGIDIYADSLNEKKVTIKAKVYVLSCGAIENARILLLSNSICKEGLCNDNDLVGRYFQGHGYTPDLKTYIHMLISDKKIFDLYGVHKYKNTNAFGFLTLSPKLQQKNKLLNSYFSINEWSSAVKDDNITTSMKSQYINILKKLGINSPAEWYSVNSVMLHEQEPNFHNRVLLIDDRDWLNQRKVKVTSIISELQIRTMIDTFRVFGNILGEKFLGKVRIESDIKQLFTNHGAGLAGHHIGTTRMSKSKKTGVVDENCKSHSIDNLYIGGSSVFPTGSATNPTFTILAMSMRLADHLKNNVLKNV